MRYTHGSWAFVYYNPDREGSAYIPDSEQSSERLRQEGWIRVSSATDIDVRSINSISQAAWDAWSTIVASCAGQIPPESEMTVSTGRDLSDYFKTTVGDFVEKYCSKGASDSYWSKLMGESRKRRTSERPSRINEVYEIHQALEALSSLAPHIANYLDGLINAGNTKEQVLGMLGKFKGYRDSLPQSIFRAMEIVVPGFRTIEDFEDRVLQMSEEELDRKLGKLLFAIQSGRLANTTVGESLVRRIVRMALLEDLKGFQYRTKGIDYMANLDDPTFEDPRQGSLVNKPKAIDVKRAWAAEADHKFMDSLIKVHWLSGLNIGWALDDFLSLPRNNEIATMGYLPGGSRVASSWGNAGVIVQGRVTLAANDMNAITSGYFKDVPKQTISKYKSSGTPRRALRFSDLTSSEYILDRETFKPDMSRHNELIVDNWKPVGIVIAYESQEFLEKVRKSPRPKIGGAPWLEYTRAVLKPNLPIYDEDMKLIDRRELEKALRGEG
jgi:hypothetical protein